MGKNNIYNVRKSFACETLARRMRRISDILHLHLRAHPAQRAFLLYRVKKCPSQTNIAQDEHCIVRGTTRITVTQSLNGSKNGMCRRMPAHAMP